MIIQPAELVEPMENPVVVDLDGNLDGLVNPNENCAVTFTLKNWGSQTASNVMAVLTSSDSDDVQITTTSPVSFGNLASGASSTGAAFPDLCITELPGRTTDPAAIACDQR